MKWIIDSDNDLLNLDHIEAITMQSLDPELAEVDSKLEGSTHEILATNRDQYSYRVFHGSEEICKVFMNALASVVEAHQIAIAPNAS